MQYKAINYLEVILFFLCTNSCTSQIDAVLEEGSSFSSDSYSQHYVVVKTEKILERGKETKVFAGLDASQMLIGRDCSITRMEVCDTYRPKGKLLTFIICAQSVAGNKHAECEVRELASRGASFNLFYEVDFVIGNLLRDLDSYVSLLAIKNREWASFFSTLPLRPNDNSMDTVIAVAEGRDARDEAIEVLCAKLPVELVALLLTFDVDSPEVFTHVRKVREEIKAYRERKRTDCLPAS